jgi:hypothetical protein
MKWKYNARHREFLHAGEPPTAGYSGTTWLALHFLPYVAVWRFAWELPSSNLGRNTDNSIDFISSLLQRELRQI